MYAYGDTGSSAYLALTAVFAAFAIVGDVDNMCYRAGAAAVFLAASCSDSNVLGVGFLTQLPHQVPTDSLSIPSLLLLSGLRRLFPLRWCRSHRQRDCYLPATLLKYRQLSPLSSQYASVSSGLFVFI